ncbi:MAG: phosphodiester glycosidase family protein [Fimbriimonadaceae bacterium]
MKPIGELSMEVITKSIAGRSVSYVVIDPRRYSARILTGKGNIGTTDEFSAMIKRSKADFAINGAFFDAYSNNKIRNTVQTLISGGRPINLSDIGCVLGFSSAGEARIDRVKTRIRGTVNGQSWYAYRINNDPLSTNIAMEYNSRWGTSTGFDGGLQVQVTNGKVTWISRTSTQIPPSGYVLLFKGSEESVGKRFSMGADVTRSVQYEAGDSVFWNSVSEGVGAGPTLVKDGRIALDAIKEGFKDPKILSESGARSMVGILTNGNVVLAVSGGTVAQMANVMHGLGCKDAMNLDGGASSGFYARSTYVRNAGRPLTNVLIFKKR